MPSESTGILAPGIALRLHGAPAEEVRLKSTMLTLKVLEDELGTVNAINGLLAPQTPTDRIARMLFRLSTQLKEAGVRAIDPKMKKLRPIDLSDLTAALLDAYGSLEMAELELAPLEAPKKAGPLMKLMASLLLHEHVLLAKSPWPPDLSDEDWMVEHYMERFHWLESRLILWTQPQLLRDYEIAVINAFDESIPKVESQEEETSPSPGKRSTGSSRSSSAVATASSGG